ncbi:MAG: hypothetical protein ACTHXA_04625 [Gulosibacter sp.]|uniref:hypothetical protein n=1 Tax=Gulosibacter sp. TaxID=2817531 RepID=UPI003F93B6BD
MAAPTTSSPGLGVHRDSVTLDFPVIVSHLRDILGAKLVAYLGSVRETRAVRQWVAGERRPSDAVTQRLRLAYHVAGLLTEAGNSPAIVQAWFQGANPQLEDRAPGRVLRDEPTDAISHQVLGAARAFARIG